MTGRLSESLFDDNRAVLAGPSQGRVSHATLELREALESHVRVVFGRTRRVGLHEADSSLL